MDIHNPTLLSISKEIIIQKYDEGQLAAEQGIEDLPDMRKKRGPDEYLKPSPCAQFMTAFAKGKMFNEVQLFERLEA